MLAFSVSLIPQRKEITVHKIDFYGLSTCIHCKHAMDYLDGYGLQYHKTLVDLLDGEEYDIAVEKVRKLNPSLSFPTILINGKDLVVGFQKDRLDQLLQ